MRLVLRFVVQLGRVLLWALAGMLWLITLAGVAAIGSVFVYMWLDRTESNEAAVQVIFAVLTTSPFAASAALLTSWLYASGSRRRSVKFRRWRRTKLGIR